MKHARVARAGWLWALATTVAALGCSAGGGGIIVDAHPFDAYEVSLDLPAGCPPASGNEKQIGKPCTRGGNECASDPNLHCTCDPFLTLRLDGVPCICTFVTVNSNPDASDLCAAQSPSACGSNASCCAYMTIGTYCVPNICLPGGECPVVGAPPP